MTGGLRSLLARWLGGASAPSGTPPPPVTTIADEFGFNTRILNAGMNTKHALGAEDEDVSIGENALIRNTWRNTMHSVGSLDPEWKMGQNEGKRNVGRNKSRGVASHDTTG